MRLRRTGKMLLIGLAVGIAIGLVGRLLPPKWMAPYCFGVSALAVINAFWMLWDLRRLEKKRLDLEKQMLGMMDRFYGEMIHSGYRPGPAPPQDRVN